jgi:hypothetical protein
MRIGVALLGACLIVGPSLEAGQARRAATRPAPATPTREAAQLICPAPLGTGVVTKRSFCDVLTGRNPVSGIIIAIPPHKGEVTLTFDLHNRHTYSEEQAKDKRAAFARYTCSIGALSMDNTLISRAAIQSEFRTPGDFVDRISGGAGATGLKAVGPTGSEPITLTIPEAETQVSILGEKLMVERADGRANYTSTGRPIAIISNVMVEYFPPPPPRAAAPKTTVRPPAAKTPARPKKR